MAFRRVALIYLLLLISAAPVAAVSGSGSTIEIAPFFGGSFKADQWLAVRVTVRNDGPDRKAVVRLGGESGASFDTPLDLPHGARKVLVMYVRPDIFVQSISGRLIENEDELAETSAKVTAWPARAEVFGLLTTRPLALPAPIPADDEIPVVVKTLSLDDLPPRAEGLASFDVLVLDGLPPPEVSTAQATALADWVRMGGQLIVGTGDGDRMLATLPTPLRIASAGAAMDRPVAGTLLAGLDPEARIRAVALSPAAGATAIDSLAVSKEWGRGRITVLGFSLGDPALQRLAPGTPLWPRLVSMKRFDPSFPPDANPAEMRAQQLTQALFNLPALALPPLTVLGLLLLAYFVLVGPALYLVLRRLDRQAWAWVAIPALTVLFSIGAYGYGLRIRGSDVILNQITIVQPGEEQARVQSYAGIFSPAMRSYDVSIGGDVLTRPLPFDGKMMGRATTQPGLTGHFLQGPSGVRALEVGQWTMSAFAADGSVPFPAATAQLELGDGVLAGTVHNGSAEILRNAALIQGGRAVMLGDIAPGADKRVDVRLDDSVAPGGQPLSMTLFRDRWNYKTGPPPELRIPIQVVDSLYGYTPWSTTSDPTVIAWLDRSPLPMHVDSGRVQYQQMTLLEMPVHVSYGRRVTLPRGWSRTEFETRGPKQGACMTQWGPGAVLASSDPLTATLQLPTAAHKIAVTKASLFTQVEGPPPDRVLVEAYDWAAGTWTQQTETLGTADLSDPARFVRNGELRVRLTIGASTMKGGCVHVGATIGGTQ